MVRGEFEGFESLWDLDNTLYRGPNPWWGLIMNGSRHPTSIGKPIKESPWPEVPLHHRAFAVGDRLRYWWRRPNKDAVLGLQLQREVAELHGVKINFGILSGRSSHLHDFTLERLRQDGLYETFGDNIEMNTGKSSTGWKQHRAHVRMEAQEQGQGMPFLITDDDWRTPDVVDMLIRESFPNARAAVLLKANPTNWELFMKLRHIYFSNRVKIYHSPYEAADFLSNWIKEGVL